MRIVVEQRGDPFAHLDEITGIWRELSDMRGTRAEIEERLRDIQNRLEGLPRDGLREATERLVENIRVKSSGEEEF
jgi:hypothetical protein